MPEYVAQFGPGMIPVVIADNGTTSAAADLKDKILVGVHLPAAVVGTSLSFLTARTLTGTYVPVQDGAGALYSVDAAASQYVPVDPAKFVGCRFLKVVSAASETGGPLTFYLAVR